MSVIEPGPWWPTIGDAVDRRRCPPRCRSSARRRCPRSSGSRGRTCSEVTVGLRPEAARYSSVASTRRSIWPLRMSAAAAAVDLDPRVGEDALGQRLLAHQQDLADRRVRRRPRRRTGSCPRRGRSRSTRAASSRRGSASGRCAGRRGRPGGSRSAGAGPCVAAWRLPMRPRIVPPMTRAPLCSGLATKSRGSKPSGAACGGLRRRSVAELGGAAGDAGGGPLRVGEQALLGGQRPGSGASRPALLGRRGASRLGGALAAAAPSSRTRRAFGALSSRRQLAADLRRLALRVFGAG